MTGTSAESDWNFMFALATTAFVIAGVVLGYMILTYRRARALERLARSDSRVPTSVAVPDREPVFFKRYVPEEEIVNREP